VTSPVPALRTLVDEALVVRDVVSGELFSVAPGALASEAAAVLEERRFDVAALRENPVRRYVHVEDLRNAPDRKAGYLARVIDPVEIVSRDTPIGEVIPRLANHDFLFVLDRDRVRWIITAADLGAPAVSLVVLAHLIAFERALAELVQADYGPEFWTCLRPGRQQKVRDLFEEKRRKNLDTSIGDCLYFYDWLELAERSEFVCGSVCEPPATKRAFRELTRRFTDARNELAHGGGLLKAAVDGPGVDRIAAVDLFIRAREAAQRAWDACQREGLPPETPRGAAPTLRA
jgi:CBS domain-containing protein